MSTEFDQIINFRPIIVSCSETFVLVASLYLGSFDTKFITETEVGPHIICADHRSLVSTESGKLLVI